jgi:hypothetical protein
MPHDVRRYVQDSRSLPRSASCLPIKVKKKTGCDAVAPLSSLLSRDPLLVDSRARPSALMDHVLERYGKTIA